MKPSGHPGALTRWVQAWPALAWWVVFFVLPLAWVVVMSFGTRPQVGEGGVVSLAEPSLANYAVASTDIFLRVFITTMRTAGLGTLICLIVGFPVAYAIAMHVAPRWRGFVMFLLILPFWTSFLLRTFAWRIILAPGGVFSKTLRSLGVIDGPLLVLDTNAAVQIGIVYNYLPITILPIYVALDRIDKFLLRASMDLGAGKLRTFLSVTLPLSKPGILGGMLITFILAAGDYGVPTILGGTKGLMVGNLVATQILSAQNLPVGAAIAVLLIAMLACVVGGAALLVTLSSFGLRQLRRVAA
jgi:spermidine/putrescine transport system permease protein